MSEMIEIIDPVEIQGAKKGGGGGGSSPIEFPDNLRSTSYARVLDIISEGEIWGLVDGAKSVFLDETPLQNADGSYNFKNVDVQFRSGTQHQDYIQGFPASESTQSAGVEIKYATPWVRSFSNTQLSAVRLSLRVPVLRWLDSMTGNIWGWQIPYAIELSTDNGAFVEVVNTTFWGKTTSGYTRTHRINLPKATTGWTVRVKRLNVESSVSNIEDSLYMADYTTVIDGKLRHPNTALVGLSVNAEQFSSIPARAYHIRGLIVQVPSNYNAATRQYVGTWDGTFKTAYTNNPAWVLYDLLTNGRYGLGKRIKAENLDTAKFELYRIGAYCDQLVDDGFGGKEPRFTCNVCIQSRSDAYRVLTDLASVFRGMLFWGNNEVNIIADMPSDTVHTYTNAKVVNGRFEYADTPRSTRYTVALVSWNDPKDMFRQKVEAYEYPEGILRYGVNKTELTAFGCSSKAQAQRLAKWVVLTSCLERETVSFSVGMEGAIALPGDVIQIADSFRAGRRIGGLIRSAIKTGSQTEIELDSNLTVYAGDRITVTLPSGKTETRIITISEDLGLTADSTEFTADSTEITADMTSKPGLMAKVTVSPAFSEIPQREASWALDQSDLSTQTFRVISVAENADSTFTISAVQHVSAKFDMVEHGIAFDPPPITVVPPKVQPAPQNVTISNYSTVNQGLEVIHARIEWEQTPHAVEYEVQWQRDGSDWVSVPRTGTTSIEIPNAFAGLYNARVRAFNSLGTSSLWVSAQATQLDGTLGEPPVVAFLKTQSIVFGVQVDWGFKDVLSSIERTELWYSQTPNRDSAVKLGEYAHPGARYTHLNMAPNSKLYFWARLVSKNGTVGAFYPEGLGVEGASSSDAGKYLEYFNGQITESQLGQELAKQIGEGAASATEIKEIQNNLAALVTIKAQKMTPDGNYVIAGIGVGVEDHGGIVQSKVYIAADQFAVVHGIEGDNPITPFVIQNGYTFIDNALIRNLGAQHIQVNQLSELTTDAGILVSGKLQGTNTNSYIDLNATGNNFVANWGNGAMTVTANGVLTINQANVIKTLNIAGGAVTTTEFNVNQYSQSQTTYPGSGIGSASYMDRSAVTVNNLSPGNVVLLTINLTASISAKNVGASGRCYGAVQILRNGTPLRFDELLPGKAIQSTNETGTYDVGLDLQGFSMVHPDIADSSGNYTYTLRVYWWDNYSGATTCTIVNSAIIATIFRR